MDNNNETLTKTLAFCLSSRKVKNLRSPRRIKKTFVHHVKKTKNSKLKASLLKYVVYVMFKDIKL